MSKRIKVNVGTLDSMGQRFVSTWHRLERGEKVRERHLTFPTLAAMLNALSPKRLELLQAVHEQPARSVKALAERHDGGTGQDVYASRVVDVRPAAQAGEAAFNS